MKILKEIDFSFPSISICQSVIEIISRHLSKKKLYIRPCQLFNVSLLELFNDFLFLLDSKPYYSIYAHKSV